MRITSLSLVVLMALAGAAQAEHRGPAPERARSLERTLSLGDIDAQVKPVSAEISRCYLDAVAGARGGHLVVQLAIHRRGKLDSVSVQSPGLPAKVAQKIETCVRAVVEPLEFPLRRTPTTAVIPYYFQLTAAPNAGPQLSCWSSRGCPGA
jgi:hypothetical protein